MRNVNSETNTTNIVMDVLHVYNGYLNVLRSLMLLKIYVLQPLINVYYRLYELIHSFQKISIQKHVFLMPKS